MTVGLVLKSTIELMIHHSICKNVGKGVSMKPQWLMIARNRARLEAARYRHENEQLLKENQELKEQIRKLNMDFKKRKIIQLTLSIF